MSSTPSPAPGRGTGRPTVPTVAAAAVNADLAGEGVRVGHGHRRLGPGDLDEALPGQRRVEAEQQRGGAAAGVLGQRTDVGGHLDRERDAGLRPGPDDPAGHRLASHRRPPARPARTRWPEPGEVVRPDVEQRTRARLEQELRAGMPALPARGSASGPAPSAACRSHRPGSAGGAVVGRRPRNRVRGAADPHSGRVRPAGAGPGRWLGRWSGASRPHMLAGRDALARPPRRARRAGSG